MDNTIEISNQTEDRLPESSSIDSGDSKPSVSGDGGDALARSISLTLGCVMREFDYAADKACRSQDDLTRSIDRLNTELDKLLEDAPLPVVMQHANKISSIRRRVAALNTLLKSVQQRIDNIDLMISARKSHDSRPTVMEGKH